MILAREGWGRVCDGGDEFMNPLPVCLTVTEIHSKSPPRERLLDLLAYPPLRTDSEITRPGSH
jgi:hypothetical protein